MQDKVAFSSQTLSSRTEPPCHIHSSTATHTTSDQGPSKRPNIWRTKLRLLQGTHRANSKMIQIYPKQQRRVAYFGPLARLLAKTASMRRRAVLCKASLVSKSIETLTGKTVLFTACVAVADCQVWLVSESHRKVSRPIRRFVNIETQSGGRERKDRISRWIVAELVD